MKIYAISDLHGNPRVLEEALERIDLTEEDSMLILLGDYIHRGYDDFEVIRRIRNLQDEYGYDRVIALMGTHEAMVLSGQAGLAMPEDSWVYDYEQEQDEIISWMSNLPYFYEVEDLCIFVHAGVNEDYGKDWEYATSEHTFVDKYPPTVGRFYTNIVAGHIGTYILAGKPGYNDIFYDGYSHYYIDGTVALSGYRPVLMVDTETKQFYNVTDYGVYPIAPYNE